MRNIYQKGFTLVELAIVIVIIGLLVGGVLQGQALIEQAKLRSVIKDYQQYMGAYNTFLAKYNCLPGDCINAQTLFSATACPDVVNNPCNGNGDKVILPSGSNPTVAAEDKRVWQHMSLAKVIKGTYTGITATAVGDGYTMQKNINMPASSYGDGAYHIYYVGNQTGYIYKNRTVMRWGNKYAPNSHYLPGGVAIAENAQSIDEKIDDGAASTGLVYAMNGQDPDGTIPTGCVNASYTAASANYVLPSTNVKCAVYFTID